MHVLQNLPGPSRSISLLPCPALGCLDPWRAQFVTDILCPQHQPFYLVHVWSSEQDWCTLQSVQRRFGASPVELFISLSEVQWVQLGKLFRSYSAVGVLTDSDSVLVNSLI